MNDRIQEFAVSAGGYEVAPNDFLFRQEQLQKFAELIVKECADRCYHLGRDSGPVTASITRVRILAMLENQK